jgi:hypothetical protein
MRETVRQRRERLDWALQRIVEVTDLNRPQAVKARADPDKRVELDYLRAAVSLAYTYAKAGRAPPPPATT